MKKLTEKEILFIRELIENERESKINQITCGAFSPEAVKGYKEELMEILNLESKLVEMFWKTQ